MTDKDTGPIRPAHGGIPWEVTVADVEAAKAARMKTATVKVQPPVKPA